MKLLNAIFWHSGSPTVRTDFFDNRLNQRRVFLLSFFILLGVWGCSGNSPNSDGVKDSAVIARVNDEEIVVKKFRERLEMLRRKYRVETSADLDPNSLLLLKTNALSEVIQNTLFRQEAGKNKVSLDRDEFEMALQEAKNGHTEETFQKYLEIESLSAEEWENGLKNNLLIKKLFDKMVNSKVSVSEEEIKQYFEDHQEEFQKGEQIQALHIMVETEEEALRIKGLLDSKDQDFSELAREYSLGPERTEGGDLGYLEKGHMPAELEDIFKLKVNQISDIIRTPYGSHIFKVVDKRKDREMSFEESRKIIHDKLLREQQDKKFQEWLSKLKDQAEIEIKDEILAKIS